MNGLRDLDRILRGEPTPDETLGTGSSPLRLEPLVIFREESWENVHVVVWEIVWRTALQVLRSTRGDQTDSAARPRTP